MTAAAQPSPLFEADTEQSALGLPELADRDFMREVLRIWTGRDPATHKQVIATSARTVYPTLTEWGNVVLAMVRTIIRDMNFGHTPLSEGDLDEATFNFLGDIAETLVMKGAVPEIAQEIEGIATEVKQSPQLTGPQAQAKQIAPESITYGHPGALAVPVEIMRDPEWQQIVSIWFQPEVENCPGCGVDHKENVILTGNSRVMTHDKFGRLLGSMASAHAAGTTETEEARVKALSEVEKNFHEFLSDGMTKQ